MSQLFANAARSPLMANILAGDTSLTVDAALADLYPVATTGTDPVPTVGKDFFKIVLENAAHEKEIVYVRTRALGDPIFSNVLRGQEGTTARAYTAGDVVGLRHTAADLAGAIDLAANATTAGKALLNAASAAAQRVVLGFSTFFSSLIAAADAAAFRVLIGSAALTDGIQGSFKKLVIDAIGVNNWGCVITADTVVLMNSTNQCITQRAVSKTITANGTVGAPLSSMSALAVDTWYFRWLWYNAAQGLTATLDTSSTAPTAPTGYASTDYKALLPGACRTDSSGSKYLMQIKTRGNYSWYVPLAGSNVTAYRTMASGIGGNPATPTFVATAVGAYVPTDTAATIHLKIGVQTFAEITAAAPNNAFTSAQGTVAGSAPLTCQGGNSSVWSCMSDEIGLESANVYYAGQASSYLVCIGWRDNS